MTAVVGLGIEVGIVVEELAITEVDDRVTIVVVIISGHTETKEKD